MCDPGCWCAGTLTLSIFVLVPNETPSESDGHTNFDRVRLLGFSRRYGEWSEASSCFEVGKPAECRKVTEALGVYEEDIGQVLRTLVIAAFDTNTWNVRVEMQ